jgi:spore germination protein YaaH/chitodextrinase
MSPRRAVLAIAVSLAALAWLPAQAAAAGCGERAPLKLTFKRTPGQSTGTLAWKAPRNRPFGGTRYRIYRDGKVVGQTNRPRMRLAVRIGRRVRFMVRVVSLGGGISPCKATLVRRVAFLRPGTPESLAVAAVGDGIARLKWAAGKRGDGTPAGFRVYRDGRVVGQVRNAAARVNLPGSKQYAFTVTAVDSQGNQSKPSAPVKVTRSHNPPTTPSDLTVTGANGTTVSLSWSASLPASGRIVGYRIYRDGAMSGQVGGTTGSVGGLASARRYEITVAAVDSLGYLSARSDPVSVSTDHRAPSAPSALRATEVTDSAVSLTWSPGGAGSSPVTGYRLARDGAALRQVPTSPAVVSNLAAATNYSFTVSAVDSWGYASPPSDPAAVRTEIPTPTQGHVHAFLLATTDRSFEDLQEHYQQIGTIYPTYFDCAADNSIVGSEDPLVTSWAKLRGVKVLPRLNCQSPTRLHDILTDPPTRSRWIDQILSLVQTYDYDGINLDFEAGLATDRPALTAFVADVASRLHAIGKTVALEVSAKSSPTTTGRSGFYDYPGLAVVADTIFVMNWGLHWTTSVPGALDEIAWATGVANYTASMPNKSRFVLGTNMYGLDWPNGGGPSNRATAMEWADVQNLIRSVGATPSYNTIFQAPYFSYTDGAGVHHDVWYTDARSIGMRIALAHDRGLGIGVWRLGNEDPGVWNDPLLAPGSVWP